MCPSQFLLVLAAAGCAVAAPQPLDLQKIGRSIRDFGQKAIPTVKGACGFFNGYLGIPAYPQGQGYPHVPVYYQPRYYPQYPQNTPNFPQYPAGFPQNTPDFAPAAPTNPPTQGQIPAGGATEVDDLNDDIPDSNFVMPQDIPPQIQDVFRNFNSLPTVSTPVEMKEDNKIKAD